MEEELKIALELVAKAKKQKVEDCGKEIQQILEKYNCRIVIGNSLENNVIKNDLMIMANGV